MRFKRYILFLVFALLSINLLAMLAWQTLPVQQDDKTRRQRERQRRELSRGTGVSLPSPSGQNPQREQKSDTTMSLSDYVVEDEAIPDSLLNLRWKVQRIVPITFEDLQRGMVDLNLPDNLQQNVEYNDTLDRYVIGSKVAGTYLSAPIMMTPEEYRKWSERQLFNKYFRSKNDEIVKTKGKEKFDFSDMHFDLGPAEKIFGPGGVRIRTQGSAELKFGATLKNIENPSLPVRNRKTTAINFDEKINLNVNGKVGDKVNMNLNYNTDATFDFDQQNLKLRYEGKEDEIIKLVEGGNITFPTNSSLIKGAASLFGLRTDLQFGKLKLQLVASQKKSSTHSVSSQGGVQLTPFEINVANYEDNRHFFLSHFFREKYDQAMKSLPNLTTGVRINRLEIWVTNKSGVTTNTRNIIALTDLGENTKISNPTLWGTGVGSVPSNSANQEYSSMTTTYAAARQIDQTSTVLDGIGGFVGGVDYEKLESARLLRETEYEVNQALGYVSLNSTLQTDQVLAVAYEYTYGGVTYQVGEFASDVSDVSSCLFVKSLKNTSNNPKQGNWDLMMKNVYYLASSVERDKFRLDVKFQSDTSGVYLNYIPEQQVKDQPIVKLLGADRLDNNNKAHPNGYFDFVEGYTVSKGRVFFPAAEPFGDYLYKTLVAGGVAAATAAKYAYTELYDSTKTVAKQIAEKNKFLLMGQYRGTSANVISLGTYNVPQGSVLVTAGGVTLREGSDYVVDYNAGEVTILNQSIIDAGTPVNVSLESNTDFSLQRKTMFGVNWDYDFNKNLQFSGTFQHLYEQSLTTKVTMGTEPLNNTLWGVNMNWKKESQWLTNLLDKLPGLHLTQPSQISLNAEFAHLIAGKNHGTQDNASYLDDFENTKNAIDVSMPTSWMLSSVPSMFANYNNKADLSSGYQRSLLSWYTIDPLFTRRSSSLTPSHIKSDLDQLSNHFVREVYVSELFPKRDQSSYNGATSTLPVLNLAYYPNERGPYNFNPALNADGTVEKPKENWGGMMRKLDMSDFETANIEYIEFWMLDPFCYARENGTESQYSGDLYINLGEISEDVLRDGKKFYESGMPVDGSGTFATTQWGKIPTQATVAYAFATTPGSRALQDVGYNGLTDAEERAFPSYQTFLDAVRGKVTGAALDSILDDPAKDNYHYFRGKDYDQLQTSILDRYKYINSPQGNSPDNDNRSESYDTSYKTMPDVEDINQDYTLNEYEKYFQYHVSIRPEDFEVGKNFIVDSRETSPHLRNDKREKVTWYQFRIPLREFQDRVGGIADFTSIRFMRMFMTGFEKPVVLRFGTLDLVRGDWRVYEQNLTNSASNSGKMLVSAVSIEENSDKTPVNYVLPPGIQRVQDPTQPQLVESNEQSLSIVVSDLGNGESKAVYKNTTLDLRQYKRLQMFVHANAMEQNVTNLQDNQLAVFIRIGSDYKSNYYEYEIPLKLTPAGHYDMYSRAGCEAVWPEENMLDVPLTLFTALKKARNMAKARGAASFNNAYSMYDENRPGNKVSIVGNPSLGEIKTMILGVRNLSAEQKTGEVWINELRLREYNSEGGWAAQANLNVQMSDFGSVNVQGRYVTEGFGGLEEGVNQRAKEDYKNYSVTTSVELGKFFPDKAKITAPLYYSLNKDERRPKFNPLDSDMELDDALDVMATKTERDSVESIVVTRNTHTNFSLSNLRVGISTQDHPMPYDPANFSFSYSHAHRQSSGETTVYEREDSWRGALNYAWTPNYKPLSPWAKLKSKSKWLDILKRFGLNWLPQNLAFNTEMVRNYFELQERDMEDIGGQPLPLTFSEQFMWSRDFTMRWDLTNNLHMTFRSATRAEIEEPYTPVNKELYPNQYEAWKDSVWTSIRNFGTPLDYNQSLSLSYQLPLNLLPIFNWISADASYQATYNWMRGSELENGTSLGNTIMNNRNLTLNGTFNMERLYNQIPFLKKTNERFRKTTPRQRSKKGRETVAFSGTDSDDLEASSKPQAKAKAFVKELTLLPDSTIEIAHSKRTKRLIVTAKTEDGKPYRLKFKKLDDNRIRILNKVDTPLTVKLSVMPKEPLDDKGWYRTSQSIARFLMMVRSISFNYRNQYTMSLPGFMPTVGDAFGQTRMGILSPGLDFAFGMTGDEYVEKARQQGWLLNSDSIATPASTNLTEDLQLRMTLEPVRDLKIDLSANHVQTRAKSIQYMYVGNPTTQSGSLTMTTISLKSAFESGGTASNGFRSASFERFCQSLDQYRHRVESSYAGSRYPVGTTLAGQEYDPANGAVNKYSADVMVPAFLNAYANTSGKKLDVFPRLLQMLPNWSVRYSGLGKLTWFKDLFKSFNVNHAYRSIFAIGSYSTFSTFSEYRDGLGFITDATTGNPVPNSMYNVSMVSINESFSPLIGVDMTFHNNLTAKMEYRSTRSVNLSMTSVQVNESSSNDWVVGVAYKINDFHPFGWGGTRKVKSKGKKKPNDPQGAQRAKTNLSGSGFNNDLNLRLDLSLRKQEAISRDVSTMTSAASSGNTAFRLSFMADYTISKMLTMSLYYDQQTNKPLLANNSYPTTTRDFGVSLRFTLVR